MSFLLEDPDRFPQLNILTPSHHERVLPRHGDAYGRLDASGAVTAVDLNIPVMVQ